MSDVKRYNFFYASEISQEGRNADFVLASDYDAAQSELFALREELAMWKGRTTNACMKLTAAEQRNAVLTKALERIARPHDCGCWPCMGSCVSKEALEITVEEMRQDASDALKPTESGASE